jgi:hypothetical protein
VISPSGDPRIKEKIELDTDMERLTMLRNSFKEEKYSLENTVIKCKEELEITVVQIEKAVLDSQKKTSTAKPVIEIEGKTFEERKETGEKLDTIIDKLLKEIKVTRETSEQNIGKIGDFDINLKSRANFFGDSITAEITGALKYWVDLEEKNALGNITRLENAFANIPKRLSIFQDKLEKLKSDIQTAENELLKPFPQEEEYLEKSARLQELNKIFNIEDEIVGEVSDDDNEIENSENFSENGVEFSEKFEEAKDENSDICGTNTTNYEQTVNNSAEKEITNSENSSQNSQQNKNNPKAMSM